MIDTVEFETGNLGVGVGAAVVFQFTGEPIKQLVIYDHFHVTGIESILCEYRRIGNEPPRMVHDNAYLAGPSLNGSWSISLSLIAGKFCKNKKTKKQTSYKISDNVIVEGRSAMAHPLCSDFGEDFSPAGRFSEPGHELAIGRFFSWGNWN